MPEPKVYPWRDAERDAFEVPLLRFTTAGSVDDGKSTLIGRLLHDAHCVHDDQMEALLKSGVNRSTGPLDFSLLTDGLKAEREQGITIDVAYRHFATARRQFLIADTPGHEQYTRNMATGASTADAAVILVDVRHGLTAQSRRHAYIAWLLGIRHLLIAVNKMDLVAFGREAFERVRITCDELAAKLKGVCLHVVPVSALDGDNVASPSPRTPWYSGPSLLRLLETIHAPQRGDEAPLRFPVQYVVRPDLEFRGYAGRIDSGSIRVGERVIVLPSGKRTRVERIATFDGDLAEACTPMAVTLVLEDELDIGRGDWICGEDLPLTTPQLEATVVWMHEQPLVPGARMLLQQGTVRVPARVLEIVHRTDPETFETQPVSQLGLNEIGLVRLETARVLVFDRYRENRQTGCFILIDEIRNLTLGGGMVERAVAEEPPRRETNDEFHTAPVTPAERLGRFGHRPAVVASRSKALRKAIERALFVKGAAAILLESPAPPLLLRELLANGLILLMPYTPPGTPGDVDRIEVPEAGSIGESVNAGLRDLELRGVLLPGRVRDVR
jgi:sulfate adenylyltransferase large subunit